MAINLLGSGNAQLDYGNPTGNNGALTIALTVTPSSIVDDTRLVSQWGNTRAEEQFIVRLVDTDEIGFIIADNITGSWKGRKTTALNLTAGTTYRIVFRWRGQNFGNEIKIWVNGATPSLTTDVNDINAITTTHSTNTVQLGYETDQGGVDGVDGNYCEFAMWDGAVRAENCLAMSNGFSPQFFCAGAGDGSTTATPMFYTPLHDTSRLIDYWHNLTITNTNGTTADHPAVIYPHSAFLGEPTATTTGIPTLVGPRFGLARRRGLAA